MVIRSAPFSPTRMMPVLSSWRFRPVALGTGAPRRMRGRPCESSITKPRTRSTRSSSFALDERTLTVTKTARMIVRRLSPAMSLHKVRRLSRDSTRSRSEAVICLSSIFRLHVQTWRMPGEKKTKTAGQLLGYGLRTCASLSIDTSGPKRKLQLQAGLILRFGIERGIHRTKYGRWKAVPPLGDGNLSRLRAGVPVPQDEAERSDSGHKLRVVPRSLHCVPHRTRHSGRDDRFWVVGEVRKANFRFRFRTCGFPGGTSARSRFSIPCRTPPRLYPAHGGCRRSFPSSR